MERWMSRFIPANSGPYLFFSWLKAAKKGRTDFDFAEGFLAGLIENISYNFDGGNYMWGRAMRLSGFSYFEVKNGSELNELYFDSKADQRAIKNGYYGN